MAGLLTRLSTRLPASKAFILVWQASSTRPKMFSTTPARGQLSVPEPTQRCLHQCSAFTFPGLYPPSLHSCSSW